MNTCAACIHWSGDGYQYRAKCKKLDHHTAFNDGCPLFEPVLTTIPAHNTANLNDPPSIYGVDRDEEIPW